MAPKGYQRVDELQKYKSSNPNVFVSMAFNDNTKSTREAIRNGIIDAGYSPEFIDEIIHNHQIVPEMFRLIRECRFLILDISIFLFPIFFTFFFFKKFFTLRFYKFLKNIINTEQDF